MSSPEGRGWGLTGGSQTTVTQEAVVRIPLDTKYQESDFVVESCCCMTLTVCPQYFPNSNHVYPNINNLYPNPTTCYFCLNRTKYHRCFVPEHIQGNADPLHRYRRQGAPTFVEAVRGATPRGVLSIQGGHAKTLLGRECLNASFCDVAVLQGDQGQGCAGARGGSARCKRARCFLSSGIRMNAMIQLVFTLQLMCK